MYLILKTILKESSRPSPSPETRSCVWTATTLVPTRTSRQQPSSQSTPVQSSSSGITGYFQDTMDTQQESSPAAAWALCFQTLRKQGKGEKPSSRAPIHAQILPAFCFFLEYSREWLLLPHFCSASHCSFTCQSHCCLFTPWRGTSQGHHWPPHCYCSVLT